MTQIIVIICRTQHFVSAEAIFKISLPNFVFFTLQSPSITQKSVSYENAFKKSKNLSLFFFFPLTKP